MKEKYIYNLILEQKFKFPSKKAWVVNKFTQTRLESLENWVKIYECIFIFGHIGYNKHNFI